MIILLYHFLLLLLLLLLLFCFCFIVVVCFRCCQDVFSSAGHHRLVLERQETQELLNHSRDIQRLSLSLLLSPQHSGHFKTDQTNSVLAPHVLFVCF